MNSYICKHRTWPSSPSIIKSPSTRTTSSSETPRITHQYPCPFSISYLSKSNNQARIRCKDMEKEPRVRGIAELCARCRPTGLGMGVGLGSGLGGGRRRWECEWGFGAVTGARRDEEVVKDERALSGNVVEAEGMEVDLPLPSDESAKRSVVLDIAAIDDISTAAKSMDDHHGYDLLLSAENGDAEEARTPAFSIFKKVLEVITQGSSSPARKDVKMGERAGTSVSVNEITSTDESRDGGSGEGKGEKKQRWVNVDEDPDWEVVVSGEKD
ncbi:uncharacterized protein RSE6_10192 [Rhynchosporium secalis]|uniref:Uncharacterized protein n=1 Tax=Rhynchosporium secalis TaxID=38038 RepID=A0A1E1MJR9_RHYSE|nr:uncharacterized protein RSE6_10192 [Rhynchosporium secalis]